MKIILRQEPVKFPQNPVPSLDSFPGWHVAVGTPSEPARYPFWQEAVIDSQTNNSIHDGHWAPRDAGGELTQYPGKAVSQRIRCT